MRRWRSTRLIAESNGVERAPRSSCGEGNYSAAAALAAACSRYFKVEAWRTLVSYAIGSLLSPDNSICGTCAKSQPPAVL